MKLTKLQKFIHDAAQERPLHINTEHVGLIRTLNVVRNLHKKTGDWYCASGGTIIVMRKQSDPNREQRQYELRKRVNLIGVTPLVLEGYEHSRWLPCNGRVIETVDANGEVSGT